MVRLLKEHGTNVNIIGGVEKLTPLCVAAKEGACWMGWLLGRCVVDGVVAREVCGGWSGC